MIVLVTFTVGLVIWVAGWAFGLKAFDVFMLTVLMTVTAAAVHIIRPHLDRFLGRKTAPDALARRRRPAAQPSAAQPKKVSATSNSASGTVRSSDTASDSGTSSILCPCSAAIVPQLPASAASMAAMPKRVASTRS